MRAPATCMPPDAVLPRSTAREAGAALMRHPGSLTLETKSSRHAYRSREARAILSELCLDLDLRSVDLKPVAYS